ncbi:T-complex protein 1 subunit beta [Nosema bombycis CQ1]|uniref:T-complex protein 1 subunit beta n=1 Tax=Nosema bombycis (strain CQ1 / CVCC 102059) TaxID=578461 RepID=R0M363_NOSB1|nr:T-complex protein 1 subunit beta [Nosema bombycis CQ1]|eukprot:EOB12444.1 T-complex protein 1 subunit beta [Nosema bombycis CQ1]
MNIFNHQNVGTTEEKGEDARRTILAGTNLIGDILKSTLGPKGMLKILKGDSNNLSVTNDGASILKDLQIDSASARILINASVGQDFEEGDGTTTVGVLTSSIIRETSKLKIHPSKIIKGLRMAQEKAEEILESVAVEASEMDLSFLIKTCLCSKVLRYELALFSEICIKAMENLKDLKMIQIIKCPGRLEDSYLDSGFILDKDIEIKEMDNPKVLIANTSLDQDKIKVFGAKISVNTVEDLAQMEQIEHEKMKAKIENICSRTFDCFINRQLIYDYPMQLLKLKNVQPIEHADFDGVERLSTVLGGKIISTFDEIEEDKQDDSVDTDDLVLGNCDKIYNVYIGNKRMIKFDGVKKGASTIVLFGSSKEMLDEAERSIHDALCVLLKIKEGDNKKNIVYGGGSSEMAIGVGLAKYALEIPGVESEAILAVADAYQEIPMVLAENGGYNGTEIRASLRNKHNKGEFTYGVDVQKGEIACMKTKNVIDSYRIKKRVIKASSEVAQMIVKCDGVVKCKPRERTRH